MTSLRTKNGRLVYFFKTVYKDVFDESMDELVDLLPPVPILTEMRLRSSLRLKWNKFQEAWNGANDLERKVLNESLGVADLAPLVLKITIFLKQEKSEHESQVNLDAMQEFVELPSTDLTLTKLGPAFVQARDIMRKYWLAMLYRLYQADKTKNSNFSTKAVWVRRLQRVKDWSKRSKSELPTAHVLVQMQGLLVEL